MQIFHLLQKEVISEWRNPFQIGGLISFLAGVSFLVYFFSGNIEPKVWNLLYWLVFLFLSFFSAARVYEEDNIKYRIYNLTLYSPMQLFLAKWIFLTLTLMVLGILLLFVYNILLPIEKGLHLSWLFLLTLVSLGFACLTSFTSFIASHGNSRQMLMVVITLPLCFPLLGTAFACSAAILSGNDLNVILTKSYPIIAIDLFAFAFVLILLPLSWKN
ncbi:MAG: ABC transporter permease [Saprospiraceae bacterium]|nr:ABC transporter permease [Saprospiraceae bacterium]